LFKKLVHRFKNSPFLVNVSKLTSGTAIAQFIAIGTAPILYRIYEKEHYGTLGLYMAITGVIGVFSTLQYLQAILLEKEDNGAINAMWLNRVINVAFTVLSLILIIALFPWITKWLNNPILNKWLWFIPISIFFAGQNEIFRVWANRKKEYNLLTFNAVFMAILTPIISIGLGLLLNNETGLFIGLIVGQSVPAFILLVGLSKKYQLGIRQVSTLKMKQLAFDYRHFPYYSLPSEFVNRFTNQLPVFMLNSYVGPAAVGVYNLAMRMLGLPIQFIGNAISTVFQQKATEDYNTNGSCKPIFVKTLKTLGFIAIIPTLIVLIFGPDLFALVFGEKWRTSGIYAQILVIMFSGKLVISPLTYIYYIAKKQFEDFLIHIYMLVSNFLIFFCLLSNGQDVKIILLTYSINYFGIYLLYLYQSLKYSVNYESRTKVL
jgi:teichuronic acid exporter